MAKLHEQIVLLCRKNLKIRFSHRCVTFCELVLPFFLTAIIGLTISYSTLGAHGGSLSKDDNTKSTNTDETKDIVDIIDTKFNCEDTKFWHYDTQYECEAIHGSINEELNMVKVKASNITYLFDTNVKNESLAEAVMAIVLGNTSATSWTRSTKSEKELEVCIAQDLEECKDIYAAVIIQSIRDATSDKNKFSVNYKIRMNKNHGHRTFHTDTLFLDNTGPHFVFQALDQAYMGTTMPLSLEPSTIKLDWLVLIGFIQIQALMDEGITKYVTSKNGTLKAQVDLSLVRMPFQYADQDPTSEVSKAFSLMYSLMFSLTIFSLMRVNSEKCSGFKELLRMHGVSAWTQWMGWLFTSFVVYGTWTVLLTLVLCLPILGGQNFLSLVGINCIIYWLLLLLYVMSITTFSYLISVFFEKVWTAVSIGLVCWILLIVFMIVTSTMFYSLTKWTAIGLMLVPTVAFDFAFRLALNNGGTFTTVASQTFENVQLTMLHCLFMLLLDSCIYMTLAIYLDNVLPSKHGIRKSPLYFLRDLRKLLTKLKRGQAKYHTETDDEDELTHASVEMTSIISGGTDQPFQSDPEHVEAAIVIQNLRKQFRRNKKRAVDGLTTKMFTGEIYALLGFNGAGKTTTIGILTGLTSPSNGYARIFDLDIRKDMEEIRKYIGLCPQHNLLFDEMTVWDQVAFFGKLKGVQHSKDKAKEILTLMGMADKLENKPEQLSGGQKRRVHLAIALIGDTKLAFLDEPTSGLDPETRRGVWDILTKLRGKLTIILTTHDMEEADLLGDRIGIMSEGKMICSGTGSFLKKYYGVGYNLKMSTADSQCDPEKVYSFVREYIPSAKMNFEGVSPSVQETSRAPTAGSISISLPTADLDLEKVADLMDALREQQQQLGVDDLGLSLSTMDEVFLKVGEVVHQVTTKVPMCDPSNNDVCSSRFVGSRLMWYRYATLVYKRMIYFLSASFTLLFLIMFFSIILLLALVTLSFAVNTDDLPDPPRVVSSSALSSYNSPIVFIHEQNKYTNESSLDYTLAYLTQLHAHSGNFKNIQVQEFPKTKTPEQVIRSLKKASIDNIHHYRQHYIVGASFDKKLDPVKLTGYYSAYAVHSAPLSLNLLSQTLIKKLSGVDAKIGVTNHPFQWMEPHQFITAESAYFRNRDDAVFYAIKSGGVIILVVIVSLLTGTSALLPAEERLNKGKHLQIMTGTTPFIYWSAMFTWDFIFFTLVNVLITVIYILADYWSGNWLFTNHGAGWVIFMILECHSFAALWFCYLLSWAPCIKTGADAFLIVNKFAIVVGVLWNIMRHLLIGITVTKALDQSYGNSGLAKSIYYISHLSGYVFWVVPMHSLYLSMFKMASMSLPNSVCHWFPQNVLDLACHDQGIQGREELFLHSCCENCRENCFQPEPSYFNTSSVILFNNYETHSLVFDILGMILSGVLFAVILFSLEYVLPSMRAKSHIKSITKECTTTSETEASNNLSSSHDIQLEEDVLSEAVRVEDIVKDDALETANHALIGHNLQLEFGKLKAVKGLSFGVHRGECFGLLGVNGAGKTSTFRIITGEIFPTSGNVYAGGLNYYKHRASYLSTLGYCPQFDGIIGSLTGLQMLKLYGALRGIPPERLKEDATIWLDKFGLLGSANKKCGSYSGGMKRRLSAAIALIGEPKLLLLDEPTTGVDPAFRRQFWNVIKEIRDRGQSVVLTSHTMDECEALCTRLGIMVDGQFKCIGNIQHLKCKFGKGYILSMKLKRVAEEDEKENEVKLNLLLEQIMEEFSPCRLQTKQMTLVQYQVLNKNLWYSDLFRAMEKIRKSDLNNDIIEEYSVTETSLEDVFISFAEKQKMVQMKLQDLA